MTRPAKSFEHNPQSTCREALIAELLRSVHFRSIAYSRCELGAPWGVRVESQHTTFHSVVQGNCWLRLEGVAGTVRLSPGDFAVVPRGGTQTVADSNATPIVDSISLLQNVSLNPEVLRLGGIGSVTSLACGSMQFENAATDPLLAKPSAITGSCRDVYYRGEQPSNRGPRSVKARRRVGMTKGWAVVTGASSGIGAEFARELTRRGYSVLAVARRRDRLEALAKEAAQRAGRVELLVADLASTQGMAL